MKFTHLVLASIAFISQISSAKTIAKLQFGAQEGYGRLSMFDVTLDHEGTLKVIATLDAPFPSRNDSQGTTVTSEKHLSPVAFREIERSIIQLTRAEIKTTKSNMVCKTFAAVLPTGLQKLEVISGYDYENNSFNGRLRTVKTAEGCHLYVHTSPAYSNDDRAVYEVKAALAVLILDAIAGN
ncbi:MAG: hypothetical protein NT027_14630 [Proteobacteria bacterium]|nr:hypothetical protein [Pseudomonadota bacterium]